MREPLISAIVSIYNAERFIRGCLEDLIRQTIFDRAEVIVIDACSPEKEGDIVREFQREHPNITYLRTEKREGLYASWNRAIRLARGKYLTNANADDRHHPEHFARLSAVLEEKPDIALAYADFRMTREANSLFETAPVTRHVKRLPYDHLELLHACEVGPQPMWRASLHEELGWFDENLNVVGDLDFWLRVSEKYPLLHIPEELGLYLSHDSNLETINSQRTYDEDRLVKTRYTRRFLDKGFVWREPLDFLLETHVKALGLILAHLKKTNVVPDRQKFDNHVFSYALLAAKLGDMRAAMDVMRMYFSMVDDGSHLAHLYGILLSTSPEKPAGTQTEVKAVAEPPLISAIMPVHNQARRMADLYESISALRLQTMPRWELVIVNDGSDDATLPVLKKRVSELGDSRIKIVSQAHGGKPSALNRGLSSGVAPFVCALAPGELPVPEYFQQAMELLLESPEQDWVSPAALFFGRRNQVAFTDEHGFKTSLTAMEGPSAKVYRKTLHEEIGTYAGQMHELCEWEFIIRCGEAGARGKTTPAPGLLRPCLFERERMAAKNCRPAMEYFMDRYGYLYKGQAADMLREAAKAAEKPRLPEEILNQDAVEAVDKLENKKDRRAMAEKLRAEYQARRVSKMPPDNKSVPVFITSYNRLSYLKRLIEWLEKSGFENITIIDNNSAYPPLLEFLRATRHKVVRLQENLGHMALWKCGRFTELLASEYFILSDPDILPDELCPPDVTSKFYELLMRFPDAAKAGFSLRIDDIPDHYIFKDAVIAWETFFWKNPLDNGQIYFNELDTTFALYRPGALPDEDSWYKAVRTGPPYTARHLPWYEDSANPSEEDIFYDKSHEKGVSFWNYAGNHAGMAKLKLENVNQNRKIKELERELREKNNLINYLAVENAKNKKRIEYMEKLVKNNCGNKTG